MNFFYIHSLFVYWYVPVWWFNQQLHDVTPIKNLFAGRHVRILINWLIVIQPYFNGNIIKLIILVYLTQLNEPGQSSYVRYQQFYSIYLYIMNGEHHWVTFTNKPFQLYDSCVNWKKKMNEITRIISGSRYTPQSVHDMTHFTTDKL